MDIFPKNTLYNTVPGAVAPVGLPTYATRARIGRGGGGRGGGGGGDMTIVVLPNLTSVLPTLLLPTEAKNSYT